MIIIITKDEFKSYEELRQKGLFNMFDLKNVWDYLIMSKERVLKIMKNYKELSLKFNEVLKWH